MIAPNLNREAIEQVAQGLKAYRDKVVFVGGAVVSLYADDTESSEIRVTEDIDITIQIQKYSDWAIIEEQLQKQKFVPDVNSPIIVRHLYKGIPVDIIPDGIGNPVSGTNKWYSYGFNNIRRVKVRSLEIMIFSPAVFLATKFEAFKNRGKDYRLSHDVEDILYVIQNNSIVVSEIADAHNDVRLFLKQQLALLMSQRSSDEILMANIPNILLSEALPALKSKIDQIINLE